MLGEATDRQRCFGDLAVCEPDAVGAGTRARTDDLDELGALVNNGTIDQRQARRQVGRRCASLS